MQEALPWIHQVAAKISYILCEPFVGLQPGFSIPQEHPNACGTLALLHFAKCLCLVDLDMDISSLHSALLALQTWPSQLHAGGADDIHRQLTS